MGRGGGAGGGGGGRVRAIGAGEALESYTGSAYLAINRHLRDGTSMSDAEHNRAVIRALDTHIGKSPLGTTEKVWRGAAVDGKKYTVGSTHTDKGFTSTTKDRGIASNFKETGIKIGGKAPTSSLFRITLPKGTRAVRGWHNKEGERIVGRGTTYKVTRITHSQGTRIIHMTAVKQRKN